MPKTIKLAIVDDSDIYRKILTSHLTQFKEFKIIIESFNGKEFIAALSKQKPDVVLLDLQMPVMDGMETTEYLAENHPDIKVLLLTVHDDNALSLDLIKKGANGFLPKKKGIDQIFDAILMVHKHQYYFAGWDLQKIISTKSVQKDIAILQENKFTDKELEIIGLLCNGHSNKEIADTLFISIRTVETHRNKILKKANTKNLARFIIYAVQHGLINFN